MTSESEFCREWNAIRFHTDEKWNKEGYRVDVVSEPPKVERIKCSVQVEKIEVIK